MTIRPLQSGDLDVVLAIAAAFSEAPRWPRSAWPAYLASADPKESLLRAAFVAADGSAVLGFAAATLLLDGQENRAELDSMAVHPSARRRGLGTSLLRAVVAWAVENGARRLSLEVRASNAPALQLYARFGFLPEGRRPGYYTDPEDDALLLGMAVTSDSTPA
jgi:[ribosomal protein S18]-alanine N-acetyltransferase